MPKASNLRWLRLAAGVVMFVFAGIIYAWSILKAPLASELNWDNAQLGLNFTITMGFFCIGGIVGSLLQKKLSQQVVTIIGGVLAFLGFFLVSRAQSNLLYLYFSYGFLAGLGIGIAYNVIISSVSSWFLDKRATASGVMMMGFGASSLLLGSVMNKLFDSVGWRQTYLYFGIAILVVLFLGSFLMQPNTAGKKTAPKSNNEGEKTTLTKDFTPKEMMSTSTFWMFYFFNIFAALMGTGIISFSKDVAMFAGAPESLAVLLVGAMAVSNGVSRIVTGFSYDNFGRAKTMYAINALGILATLLIMAAIQFKSVPLIVAAIIVAGFSFGALPPISSGFASELYGPKHFATNFSITNTQLLFSSFSATLSGLILSNGGSYMTVFVIFFIALFVALVLNVLIQRKEK